MRFVHDFQEATSLHCIPLYVASCSPFASKGQHETYLSFDLKVHGILSVVGVFFGVVFSKNVLFPNVHSCFLQNSMPRSFECMSNEARETTRSIVCPFVIQPESTFHIHALQ